MDRPSADGNGADARTQSMVKKRSVVIQDHKTSISLEDGFWDGLKAIASSRNTPVCELVNAIDAERQQTNLSSAIRLYVLNHYRVNGAASVQSA